MEIFEKAKELGNLISESKELLMLREAETAMVKNEEAMNLLNEFGSLRQEYAQALSESQDPSSLEDMKQRFLQKNSELFENPVTKSYIEAKNKVDNIFKTVSDILQRSVNGNQEEAGGCSSEGCSSCGCGCS